MSANLTQGWLKQLESTCNEYDELLLTGAEFDDALNQLVTQPSSPLAAIKYEVINTLPFERVSLGKAASGDPTDLRTLDHFDSYGSSCRVQIWRRPHVTLNSREDQELNDLLARLITAYWKPSLRDEKARLISFHNASTYRFADNSIARYVANAGTVCAFFCDLDQFKKLNDTHGMPVGDGFILALAAIIDKHSMPNAIALHRSGDEFIILYPGIKADEALMLATQMMSAVKSHRFEPAEPAIGLSAGIAVLEGEVVSYKELEARAEKALKPGEGIKNRGTVRIASHEQIQLPPANEVSFKSAACLIKSCAASRRPFESSWLNLLSRFVHNQMTKNCVQTSEIAKQVEALIAWVKPSFDPTAIRSSLPATQERDYTPAVSSLDLSLAVAHGLLRAGLVSGQLNLSDKSLLIQSDESGCSLTLKPDDILLARFDSKSQLRGNFDLGGFISYVGEDAGAPETKRAILIKIGHFQPKVPSALFLDVIVVDDRPTRGGGLPDFWEAAIARLVARVNINPNVSAVYILGNHGYGAQTIAKLNNVERWDDDAEEMSYKTGMSVQSLKIAVEQLMGKIQLPEDENALIFHLEQVLRPEAELRELNKPTNLERHHRFLQRDLNLKDMALETSDGCRVETVAQAFPVVLEIARRAGGREAIVDQAGELLRELIDFKVHLTKPMQDQIPAFYDNDQSSLQNYFEHEFLSENGLFGGVFIRSGQLGAVLDHVKSAISEARPFSTRRAVLVVPHEIKPCEELAPLGLISVRIIPRLSQNRIVLHYSYTWRTVEALVGFPYSLYGSVKFSEHLTNEVRSKLSTDYAGQVEMGDVSYIAHSLHIFMDEHGQNIAKRIVDNASI